tara:strand:- start:1300 stop:1599 length:300 start_codon:yes stop_codon:yes gene_type:complete
MSGPYPIPSGSQINQFKKFGDPGKYFAALSVNNTTTDFTGSNYGYGAVMVGESSATGTIILSGGGSINIAHLTVGQIYDLSPAKITVNAKTVYALKRQQ